MAFDFIGTTPDESGEDSGTIQVNPTFTALRGKKKRASTVSIAH
jgi:hypothetical protein